MSYPTRNSPRSCFHVVRESFGRFAYKYLKSALSYFPNCCFQPQTSPGTDIEGGFPFGYDPHKKYTVNVRRHAIRKPHKIQMMLRLKRDYFVVE